MIIRNRYSPVEQQMDVVREIETRYKVPRTVLAFLAIVFGVLILVFPIILPIVIALFLIVWGLMEAFNMGNAKTHSTTTAP